MEIIRLNDHHRSVIDNYLQFIRYQRQQYLKSVEGSFQDILDTRLLEEAYTKDEVADIICSVKDVIYIDLETELVNFSHTNVLLLNQLFIQAEKWHLELNVDLSEIQNRELLESIQILEKENLKLDRPKLTPIITESDRPNQLLRNEINNLQDHNEVLMNDVKDLQEKILKLRDENEKLNLDCEVKNEKISELINTLEAQKTEMEEKLKEHYAQNGTDDFTQSEKILNDYETVLQEQIGAELDHMRNQIMSTQAQLTLAEKELEKKFNKTVAYENMKKIINKKNEQIRELRKHLMKYEEVNFSEEASDNAQV